LGREWDRVGGGAMLSRKSLLPLSPSWGRAGAQTQRVTRDRAGLTCDQNTLVPRYPGGWVPGHLPTPPKIYRCSGPLCESTYSSHGTYAQTPSHHLL
jgi:hypothetical protein